jgi:hypothetical protein
MSAMAIYRQLTKLPVATNSHLATGQSAAMEWLQTGAALIACPDILNISKRNTFGVYLKLSAGSVRHNLL